MNLDDRLRTVLDVSADGSEAARAQYRQIVDLLGSGKAIADGALVAAGFLRLAALARRLPAAERAAILADPATRLRSPALIAQLCEGEPEVAAATLAAADLDEAGWHALDGVLDDRSRAVARRSRGAAEELLLDTPLPPAPAPQRPSPSAPDTTSDIGDIVARIERFRIARREAAERDPRRAEGTTGDARPGDDDIAAPPPIAAPRTIDCLLSPEGRIGWASDLAPMVSGLTLSAGVEAAARVDEASATALRRQQAVRGGRVTIAASPVISGAWRLDAAPNFDAVGRFLGHHARLTRDLGQHNDPRGDLVRQALHELRTPINALQGFAEIIQQQLFGAVPHQYRALAANIAGETAALLAALEEIDRLVRLRGGTRPLAGGPTDVGALMPSLLDEIAPLLGARGAFLDAHYVDPEVTVAMAESDLERLLGRLLRAVAAAAGPGERVTLDLARQGDSLAVALGLPKALANLSPDALFGDAIGADATQDLATGMLGRGFALRLATAEAHAAGGSLTRTGARLELSLPCAPAAKPMPDEAAA